MSSASATLALMREHIARAEILERDAARRQEDTAIAISELKGLTRANAEAHAKTLAAIEKLGSIDDNHETRLADLERVMRNAAKFMTWAAGGTGIAVILGIAGFWWRVIEPLAEAVRTMHK